MIPGNNEGILINGHIHLALSRQWARYYRAHCSFTHPHNSYLIPHPDLSW
jgi:hypothetical protein